MGKNVSKGGFSFMESIILSFPSLLSMKYYKVGSKEPNPRQHQVYAPELKVLCEKVVAEQLKQDPEQLMPHGQDQMCEKLQ